ncbi:MAG: galactokinase family protein [Ignavibacteriaceae bacterium]
MDNNLKNLLSKLYNNDLDEQVPRYSGLIKEFVEKFGREDYQLFSSPGRTEIGGNHTDHNHGKVIAASINLDSIAVASPRKKNEVILYSEGYKDAFVVNLDTSGPVKEEKLTTSALIRGVAAGFKKYGYKTGGFEACITSNVLVGSGLSSSASIEVLIGTIFNFFYNEGKVPADQIAIIGQYSENNYFGKPCGLMDQVACATGGIITIDFYDPQNPVIKKINFDFLETRYRLIVVNTEGNHADLTEDYAAIPNEMKKVAEFFGKKYCADVSEGELLSNIKELRKRTGDRAILRAIHFIEENKRVIKQVEYLNKNLFNKFISLVNESGNSSYKYLQNIFSPNSYSEQGVSLGLVLSDIFIKRKGRGACRVHGGGFAGTIQLFLPEELIAEYTDFIADLFNRNSVKVLLIRDQGAVCLNNL